jgi:hypothetical protein
LAEVKMKILAFFATLSLFWGISGQALAGPPPPYPPADTNIPMDPDGTPPPVKEVKRAMTVKHGELQEVPDASIKKSTKKKMPVPPETVMQPE